MSALIERKSRTFHRSMKISSHDCTLLLITLEVNRIMNLLQTVAVAAASSAGPKILPQNLSIAAATLVVAAIAGVFP